MLATSRMDCKDTIAWRRTASLSARNHFLNVTPSDVIANAVSMLDLYHSSNTAFLRSIHLSSGASIVYHSNVRVLLRKHSKTLFVC
jgi:hypothetical protein